MTGSETHGHPPNFISMFKGLTEAVMNIDTHMFAERVWPVFSPMLTGSIPMAIIVGIVSYFALLPFLKAVQERRVARRTRPVPMTEAGI